jgi:hypothetical protein
MKKELTSQYIASFQMLKISIEKCPDALWVDNSYKNIFWQVIYHTLHYTNLYLPKTEESFKFWEKHINNWHRFEHLHGSLKQNEETFKYSKSELMEYANLIANKVENRVMEEELNVQCGFDWLPMNKLELHLYNLRHLQHHIGQLNERLSQHGITGLTWIG